MSGKSTWIANLFSEEITQKLRSICQLNEEGQTKIATYYTLYDENGIDLRVNAIDLNMDYLESRLEQKKECVTLEKLKEVITIQEEEIDGIIKYLTSDEFKKDVLKINPIELLEKVINDKEVSKEETINYIELAGSGSDETRNLLSNYRLNEIRIRDTRGFLDETEDKMIALLKERKKKSDTENEDENPDYKQEDTKESHMQALLDGRGVYGIDACVFMTIADSNALSKTPIKGIYEPLITTLLTKCPTFLVGRYARLTETLDEEKNKSYHDCYTQVMNSKYFTGFKDIRKLLENCMSNESSDDYRTAIMHKHYKELLLPELSIEIISEGVELYRKSAVGALDEILKGIEEYHHDLAEADEFLNKLLGSHSNIAKDIFDKYFIESIRMNSKRCHYDSDKYKYTSRFLAGKMQGGYLGSLVGQRGGLSTPLWGGGHVGDAAIDILQTAYLMKEYVYSELIEELTPDIQNYIESLASEKSDTKAVDIDAAVSKIKLKLTENYHHKMDTNFERLSITDRMIPRGYLQAVYDDTCKELEITEDNIRRYLPELADLYDDMLWREYDRISISAVKHITWKVIKKSME